MSRQGFLRLLIGLTLVLLALACDVLQPVVLQPTPDLVATEVAKVKTSEAVQAFARATLTVEASRITQVPSPTKTPEPTLTLSQLTPTATKTPVASQTPTATSVSPAAGVVRGVLLDKSSGRPVSKQRVFLASATVEEGGKFGYTTEWDAQGEIRNSAYTDAIGAFTIQVSPGTYVLVSPGGSPHDAIARDSVTGTALFIKVIAGQTIDLGKIQASP